MGEFEIVFQPESLDHRLDQRRRGRRGNGKPQTGAQQRFQGFVHAGQCLAPCRDHVGDGIKHALDHFLDRGTLPVEAFVPQREDLVDSPPGSGPAKIPRNGYVIRRVGCNLGVLP